MKLFILLLLKKKNSKKKQKQKIYNYSKLRQNFIILQEKFKLLQNVKQNNSRQKENQKYFLIQRDVLKHTRFKVSKTLKIYLIQYTLRY